MDYNALELFVRAAEAGSFSEAARQTGVPLPTLSRQVRRLESDLGLRLLDRGPAGLGLTAAGTRLVADAGPALASLAQAEQRLQDASGVAGTLRVSVPPHVEPLWEVFCAFGTRYPSVRFDVFVTDRRVDLVADGIDVAIRVGEGGATTYAGPTLTRYRHVVVASPGLLQRHPIAGPDDLAGVPCGCFRSGAPSTWQLGTREVPLSPTVVTNDYRQLLHLAESGAVVVEAPPFLARPALESGSLRAVLPDHPLPSQPIRALVVERRAMSPLVRHFLDHLKEQVASALMTGRSPREA